MKVLNNLIKQEWKLKIPVFILTVFLSLIFYTNLASQAVYVINPQCGSAFENINGAGDATCAQIGDDGEVSPSLGFNFVYFNTIVTSITIGNNGAIVMASGQQVSLSNSCPPTTNNMVMPWWDDMDDAPGFGNVCYATRGIAPNRRFIAQWSDICNYPASTTNPTITFQVVFYETTNVINFVYLDAIFGGSYTSDDGGGGATVAIRGPVTDPGVYMYSCNTNSVTNGQCISFAPPAPSDCAITCPQNIVVNNDPGTCEANVSVPVPTLSECLPSTTVLNDFNNSSNASGIYPIGTTEVEWTAQEPQSAPLTCTMTVTVNNTQDIELNCPDDIELTLNPGDCVAYPLWETPVAFSCNGFGAPPATVSTINVANNGNSPGGMVMFNLTNNFTSDMTIVGMSANITNGTQIAIYRKNGTYVGSETNAGAWTLVYTADATAGPFSGPYPGNGTLTPFVTNFTIPPGTSGIALHTISASSNYTNGTGANQFFSDGNLDITLGYAANALFAGGFTPRVWNGSVTYGTLEFNTEATLITSLGSGEPFPVGTTPVTYTATDSEGNTATCTFNVTVHNYPNPTDRKSVV